MSGGSGPQRQAAQVVLDWVREALAAGRLRPGDRLPAERDLSARLGISRPSVRTGLQVLAALGVVEIRRGSGTFLASGTPAMDVQGLEVLAELHGLDDAQLFEARSVLEVGIAGLAAERATAEDRAALSEAVMEMLASLDDFRTFMTHDLAFHRALAAATHNPILAALMDGVLRLLTRRLERHATTAESLRLTSERHRKVYLAVRRGDPAGARRAMAALLEHSRDRLGTLSG